MAPPTQKKRGIWQNSRTHGGATNDDNLVDKVADFSYSSDALAQLIVDLWLGNYGNLIAPSGPGTTQAQYQARSAAAKAVLAARGIYLEQPIVVTEAEYDRGFSLEDAGLYTPPPPAAPTFISGVVFVVPDQRRATTTVLTPPSLLETAKMLMAITPNGI
jgi:hypothetical protein